MHPAGDGGQQKTREFRALNPHGLILALAGDGDVLPRSPAILKWLGKRIPTRGAEKTVLTAMVMNHNNFTCPRRGKNAPESDVTSLGGDKR